RPVDVRLGGLQSHDSMLDVARERKLPHVELLEPCTGLTSALHVRVGERMTEAVRTRMADDDENIHGRRQKNFTCTRLHYTQRRPPPATRAATYEPLEE